MNNNPTDQAAATAPRTTTRTTVPAVRFTCPAGPRGTAAPNKPDHEEVQDMPTLGQRAGRRFVTGCLLAVTTGAPGGLSVLARSSVRRAWWAGCSMGVIDLGWALAFLVPDYSLNNSSHVRALLRQVGLVWLAAAILLVATVPCALLLQRRPGHTTFVGYIKPPE